MHCDVMIAARMLRIIENIRMKFKHFSNQRIKNQG